MLKELFNKERGLKDVTATLNEKLSKKTPAYEILEPIRKHPRPIVVDFNNVIADNSDPLALNPEAPEFLSSLGEAGEVFVITTARSWTGVHKFLKDNDLWTGDMVG